MKFVALVLILSLCMLLLPVSAFADDDNDKADKADKEFPEIHKIDIFPSGAKFIFDLDLDEDEKDFKVCIPGAFNANSVRLLNAGEALDFKVIEFSQEEWLPSSLAEIKKNIDEQNALIAKLNAKKTALEQTKNLLKNIKPHDTDGQKVLQYVKDAETMTLNAENELADIKIKVDNASKIINRLKKELNAKMPQNAGKFIEISGTAKNKNKKLMFEAFTDSARWYPKYTMSLDTETGGIKTQMYAKLLQRTGLDYNGVVTFHTKYPDENVTNPVIRPLKVALKPKERNYSYSERKAAAPMAMYAEKNMAVMVEDTMAEEFAEDEAAEIITPVMRATLADNSVQGKGAVTGDGVETEFMLGEIKLTGKTELVLIPEQRSSAWIIVNFDDITTPLIPGRAELFIDNQPSGQTNIPEYGIGRSKFPFGYAPQITAKKEAMVEKKGSSWFSGGVFTSGYTIQVSNSMSIDKVITVKDRLPIPTDEKIKLEVKRISPEPKERDYENKLTWEIPVKSGETVKIIVDYTLNYPSGETLEYK